MKHFIGYSLTPLAALPLLALSVTARADTPLSTDATTVNITATVVDNTCEVDAATAWTLLNPINVSDIMHSTAKAAQPVSIVLKNCGADVHDIVVSTTDPAVDGQGQIANQADKSSATNVKAEILAGDNAKTAPGTVLTPTTPIKFTPAGDSSLKFNVKLLPVGSAKPTAGTFMANVALNLGYE
ncbi:hypothetical protein ACO03_21275 (plasmid) [Pantoea ananatis]|nr:hypothetical protein ACO03_21275 [Pantoea ananatis]